MYVIIDRNADKSIFDSLNKMNVTAIKSFDLAYLYKPVNTHPDLQIHFTDNTTAVAAPVAFDYYRSVLPQHITLLQGSKDPGKTYPSDCSYNIARMGNKIIGNIRKIDDTLMDIYLSRGYDFIDVKQGYTKCNLCITGENAAITEDAGIFKALLKKGVRVLKLNCGEVALNGFDYGFIGGASGQLGKNKIAFCGNVQKHSQYSEIKNFLDKEGVDIICLSETNLNDFGSLIFFE